MFAKQAAAVLAFAAATSAFLIPPELSASEINNALTNPVVAGIIKSDHERLAVDCPGCPVPVLNNLGLRVWKHDIPSRLEFTFDTTDFEGQENGALLLNGGLIYPWKDATKVGPAVQLITKEAGNEMPWGIQVNYVTKAFDRETGDLIIMSIDVFELDGRRVSGIDTVSVEVVKATDGHLYILNTYSEAKPEIVPHVIPAGPHCDSMACKLKAFVDAKLAGIPKMHGRPKRPCGKKVTPPGFPSGAPRPHHHHGHGHMHHNALMRSLRATLNGAAGIAAVIVSGLVMGVIAYFIGALLGMIVGNFVILLWRVFYRGGRRGTCCMRAADVSESDDETKAFVADQEPPPVYEDVADEKSAL